MNKLLFVLGLIAVFGLMIGCTQVQQPPSGPVAEPDPAPVVEEEKETTEPVTEEDTTEESTPAEAAVPEISEEELEQLKEDLEGMEFEDLGGLSE